MFNYDISDPGEFLIGIIILVVIVKLVQSIIILSRKDHLPLHRPVRITGILVTSTMRSTSDQHHRLVTMPSSCGHHALTVWSASPHHVITTPSPSGHHALTIWSPCRLGTMSSSPGPCVLTIRLLSCCMYALSVI